MSSVLEIQQVGGSGYSENSCEMKSLGMGDSPCNESFLTTRPQTLVAQFGLALTFSCLGLGLISLVSIEWSRYTPSLRTGNV
jgi:hypothetical protein